jgi:hypothetical protein
MSGEPVAGYQLPVAGKNQAELLFWRADVVCA